MDAGLSYRETAVAGASPVRLVILLYQQAIEDLRRALQAVERRDIESRTREIDHALQVIGHLRATLDQERGGIVAHNLDRFYAQVIRGLMEAQCQQSAAALEQQITNLMLVCDAWCDLEHTVTSRPEPSRNPSDPHPSGDWSA